MDWSAIVPLIGQAAPTIGGLLGGLIPFPGGAILGQVAGKVLAEALGTAPTPEAVSAAITGGDPATIQAKLSEAETRMQTEVERHKADLGDTQDARATNLGLVKEGSHLSWAPAVISVVIIVGFIVLSFLAMKPETAGVRSDVTLYLLGAWQSLATAVVGYWIGSSAGSADKSIQLAALTAQPAKKR